MTDLITVRISRTVEYVLGLDDAALMADITRTSSTRFVTCTGTRDAIRYLALVCMDYSGIDGDDIGEGFSAADRRACARAYRRIMAQLDAQ